MHPHSCVVHVGFGGSRVLYDNAELSADDKVRDPDVFEAQLVEKLAEAFTALRVRLKLPDTYFFCAISQLAIGGDSVFTRACREHGHMQQVFLPQHWDEYLRASDASGVPDFTEAQRHAAHALRNSEHIVLERVVSEADTRNARFHETNLETLQNSDAVICLLRDSHDGKGTGGTLDLLEFALNRGLPVLEMRVKVKAGLPVLSEIWHEPAPDYVLPGLPPELPRCDDGAMLEAVDRLSLQSRRSFEWYALVIIGTHLLATTLATLVLMLANSYFSERVPQDGIAVWSLLGLELVVLVTGFVAHLRFHKAGVSRQWAAGRLVREILRAKHHARCIRAPLSFLDGEKFPQGFKPYLRTLNSHHLAQLRQHADIHWLSARETYLLERFTSEDTGQIPYYQKNASRERRRLENAHGLFRFFASVAILATGLKLAKALHVLPIPYALAEMLSGPLGVVAIVFPTLAVGTLSLVASLDLEARVHAFGGIVNFLHVQRDKILKAHSEKEFNQLVMETERQLLNEIVMWFNRRSFSGIT